MPRVAEQVNLGGLPAFFYPSPVDTANLDAAALDWETAVRKGPQVSIT